MRKLFVNGKIRTIDKDNHLVTAFAVEDGKFIAVGTEEEVRKAQVIVKPLIYRDEMFCLDS